MGATTSSGPLPHGIEISPTTLSTSNIRTLIRNSLTSVEDGIVLYTFSAGIAQQWLNLLQNPVRVLSNGASKPAVTNSNHSPRGSFTKSQQQLPASPPAAAVDQDDDLALAVLSLNKEDSQLLNRSTEGSFGNEADMMNSLIAFINQETEINNSNVRLLLEGGGAVASAQSSGSINMGNVTMQRTHSNYMASRDSHEVANGGDSEDVESSGSPFQSARLAQSGSDDINYRADHCNGNAVFNMDELEDVNDNEYERNGTDDDSLDSNGDAAPPLRIGVDRRPSGEMMDIALDSVQDTPGHAQSTAPVTTPPKATSSRSIGTLFGALATPSGNSPVKPSGTESSDLNSPSTTVVPVSPTTKPQAGTSSVKSKAAAYAASLEQSKARASSINNNSGDGPERRRSSMNKLLPEMYEQQGKQDDVALSAVRSNHILQCKCVNGGCFFRCID
jgi:hypothetical protein